MPNLGREQKSAGPSCTSRATDRDSASMGLFDRWFGGKGAAGAPPEGEPHGAPPLPANAVVFANDVVLSALIGPPGAPVEGFLERAARGEVTPVVIDASLYWTWCAVQPEDTIDLARFGNLLRYARIIPTTYADEARTGHGWTPPTEHEKAHWRDVVFDRQQEEEIDEAPGSFLCSACYTTQPMSTIRVIPWWNADARDVITSYRCGGCWLGSLEETRVLVDGPAFDADVRAAFVAFLERHHLGPLAAEVARDGAPPLRAFLERVRTREVVLKT